MSGHTPGPWQVTNGIDVFTWLGAPNANGARAAHNDGWYIADCRSIPTTAASGEQVDISRQEAEANARLIAAAPELLEACQAARALTPDGTHTAKVLDAAIAKATGSQP